MSSDEEFANSPKSQNDKGSEASDDDFSPSPKSSPKQSPNKRVKQQKNTETSPVKDEESDDESDYDDDMPLIELYSIINTGSKRKRSVGDSGPVNINLLLYLE